jgi:hypothetical protein
MGLDLIKAELNLAGIFLLSPSVLRHRKWYSA